MSTPCIGQITLFGGSFAPRGFAFCNGQQMSIAQNQALFALIGVTYGGDGITTFNLPDLQSRLPMHYGQGPGLSSNAIGTATGVTDVTLTTANMPAHNHALYAANTNASTATVSSTVLPAVVNGEQPSAQFYDQPSSTPPTLGIVSLAPQSCSFQGANIPHDNMMPSLCVSFVIALQGVYPSRN